MIQYLVRYLRQVNNDVRPTVCRGNLIKLDPPCQPFLDNEDEIFVDAATIEPMQESYHESMERNIFDQDSSPTTGEQDPIFHAYTTQQSEDDQNVMVEVNSSETQATASDVSLLECNELEWDTCIIDQNTPLNEGTIMRNLIWARGRRRFN